MIIGIIGGGASGMAAALAAAENENAQVILFERQARLGRKILVCVGDARNDLTMLEGADFAFVPADAVLRDQFPNVCPCGEGAVADVIYEKIPEILKNQA